MPFLHLDACYLKFSSFVKTICDFFDVFLSELLYAYCFLITVTLWTECISGLNATPFHLQTVLHSFSYVIM